MTDILGATNQIISSAKTLTGVGPVSSISGITSSIKDVVGGVSKTLNQTITSISSGAGLILSVADSGIVEADYELPMKNVLHQYATYDYVLSLCCLDTNGLNFPGSSYIAGNIPPLICKSAGASPYDRITLANGKKYDFYIDDLVITSGVGFSQATGNTNTFNLEFTVTEPYSMGMFIEAMQIAAYNQGYQNFNGAAYLMIIEFKGNKENGQMYNVPNSRRFITFNLNNYSMKVTEAGSVYTIAGHAVSGTALNDTYTRLKSDITITGKTVQEILQSGPKSLQNVVNEKYKQIKSDGSVKVQDEILILFPKNISSEGPGAAISVSGNTETSSSATKDPTKINDKKLFDTLGVSRSSSSAGLVQLDGTCNELGKATLGFDVNRGGTPPFPNDNAAWDNEKKIWIRSDVVAEPGTTDFKFGINSDIINAINQVLLKSSIAVTALNADQMTKEGMRPWWRIDTQTYHIASDENIKITGDVPKLLVYRIVPYQVHASNFLPPNAPAPGISELKKQAAKEYNYIYTGKNNDLLKFEFDVKNTFYTLFTADNFSLSGDIVAGRQMSSAQQQTALDSEIAKAKVIQGDSTQAGRQSTRAMPVSTETSTDYKGGTRGETAATRAARLFHDALIKGVDMVNITFDIAGDPYYITSSGCGNYTNTQTTLINVTKDGQMNYQSSEVDVVINFRTPTDLSEQTGMYELNNSELCAQFSGLYQIMSIKSEFRQGQFKQTLSGNRRQGQDNPNPPSSDSILSSDKIPDPNKGLSVENLLGTDLTKALNSITPTFTSDVQATINNSVASINNGLKSITPTFLSGGTNNVSK